MSASDLVLARQAIRTAITHLRRAQVGASHNDRHAIEIRIKDLEALVHAVTRDVYAVQHPEAA